jgi:hypothetical protein
MGSRRRSFLRLVLLLLLQQLLQLILFGPVTCRGELKNGLALAPAPSPTLETVDGNLSFPLASDVSLLNQVT